jgi:hypothetical protein
MALFLVQHRANFIFILPFCDRLYSHFMSKWVSYGSVNIMYLWNTNTSEVGVQFTELWYYVIIFVS